MMDVGMFDLGAARYPPALHCTRDTVMAVTQPPNPPPPGPFTVHMRLGRWLVLRSAVGRLLLLPTMESLSARPSIAEGCVASPSEHASVCLHVCLCRRLPGMRHRRDSAKATILQARPGSKCSCMPAAILQAPLPNRAVWMRPPSRTVIAEATHARGVSGWGARSDAGCRGAEEDGWLRARDGCDRTGWRAVGPCMAHVHHCGVVPCKQCQLSAEPSRSRADGGGKDSHGPAYLISVSAGHVPTRPKLARAWEKGQPRRFSASRNCEE